MFMKLLDDNQLKAEANANLLGVPLKNKVFHDGMCVISENPRQKRNTRICVGMYSTTLNPVKC